LEIDPEVEVERRSLNEWLTWRENRLQRADPAANGVEGIFEAVGAIWGWSYRD